MMVYLQVSLLVVMQIDKSFMISQILLLMRSFPQLRTVRIRKAFVEDASIVECVALSVPNNVILAEFSIVF